MTLNPPDLMTWHCNYEKRDDKSFMGVSSP
jgi:hypothetical protein